MVAPGSTGKHKNAPPSRGEYLAIVGCLALYSVVGGYFAAVQPQGAGWRFFSWHPFLMMVGMIGCMGSAAIIKKLGGYTNTKLHGMITWAGLFCCFGGLYVIYTNKEEHGHQHWQTNHAIAGIVGLLSCIGLGLVGGIVLHPDFGVDKTNKTIRLVHKWAARCTLLFCWFVAFLGINTLTQDSTYLAIFAVPLGVICPIIFM